MTLRPSSQDIRQRRLDRQFRALAKAMPWAEQPLNVLRQRRWRLLRIPAAILLILGGILSILPVLSIWMLPIGLLLLAVDIPFLQQPVSSTIVRLRLRARAFRRR